MEREADIEAKDNVNSAIVDMNCHPRCAHLCMAYQHQWTPLLWAARWGHFPAVEYLVDKGAELNVPSPVRDGIADEKSQKTRCACVRVETLH